MMSNHVKLQRYCLPESAVECGGATVEYLGDVDAVVIGDVRIVSSTSNT
jgi:hypothetical protein